MLKSANDLESFTASRRQLVLSDVEEPDARCQRIMLRFGHGVIGVLQLEESYERNGVSRLGTSTP